MLSGTTQVDGYRPLFLPTILVGDHKLGGISSTIAAYEALLLRGYIVDAIAIFRDTYYRNWEYISEYFRDRDVSVSTIDPPPPIQQSAEQNTVLTERYYEHLLSPGAGVSAMHQHLEGCHARRVEELDSMARRSRDTFWYPFVQHGLIRSDEEIQVIDSAHSDNFSVYTPAGKNSTSRLHSQWDGSASWWTQALGHAHFPLTLAGARASGRYGHVMFPKATHLPALRLAEKLVHDGPGKGWASRAFFSDDGSTGMEIALKMALRSFTTRHKASLTSEDNKSLGILGLKGSYHGDTIGAMDACEEGVYTCEWHHAKGFWIDPPTIQFHKGKLLISVPPSISTTLQAEEHRDLSTAYDVSARLSSPLAQVYRQYVMKVLQNLGKKGPPTIAALVLEPLVLGAGGMKFVDPLLQRVLIDVVREKESRSDSEWAGLPIIFDEVFVGLYRLGVRSATEILGVKPDISVHAKILTGGMVPLAITLASDSIFQSFWSESKVDSLLHGHSYTAHAIGCEIANETLKIIDDLEKCGAWGDYKGKWAGAGREGNQVWSFWSPDFVATVGRLAPISGVMTLGTVLALQFEDDHAGMSCSPFLCGSNALQGYASHSAEQTLLPLREIQDTESVNFRTLGNVAYFMTSLNTPPSTVHKIEQRLLDILRAAKP